MVEELSGRISTYLFIIIFFFFPANFLNTEK